MRLASKSRVGVGRKDLIVNVADQFEDKGCAPAEQNHTVCRLEASQEPPLFGEDQVAEPAVVKLDVEKYSAASRVGISWIEAVK